MISGFQALRQARVPGTGLEPTTEGSLQISGRFAIHCATNVYYAIEVYGKSEPTYTSLNKRYRVRKAVLAMCKDVSSILHLVLWELKAPFPPPNPRPHFNIFTPLRQRWCDCTEDLVAGGLHLSY
ncbi:hypothetical protein PoB_006414700 [Plakobranchus ocellatus]|uniref:Uncharacterized protein n=1 Tax=Plakobranchus ocellatus TaxID=259542 RepID=A0AAV4D0A7_9GAST|nr:hypothetical protein PoB_006414700 [Plakobranchus ocellatus]